MIGYTRQTTLSRRIFVVFPSKKLGWTARRYISEKQEARQETLMKDNRLKTCIDLPTVRLCSVSRFVKD